MRLGLDRIVDQNYLSQQAPEIPIDRVKPETTLGSGTEHKYPAVLTDPSPDVQYYELKLDGTLRPSGDGGVFFRSLSPADFCDQMKMDARIRAAELLATDMDKMRDKLSAELSVLEPELAKKSFGFSIDETGLIRPIGLSEELTQREESVLSRRMNENRLFSGAAGEYIWVLAGLVDRTLQGLNAPCARYFTPAGKGSSSAAPLSVIE